MSQPEDQIPEAIPTYGAPLQQDQPRLEEPARLGPLARLLSMASPSRLGFDHAQPDKEANGKEQPIAY